MPYLNYTSSKSSSRNVASDKIGNKVVEELLANGPAGGGEPEY